MRTHELLHEHLSVSAGAFTWSRFGRARARRLRYLL